MHKLLSRGHVEASYDEIPHCRQVYSLAGLEEGLKRAYRSVTEGKFGDALSRFNGLLHLIPLLVVDTRKEVDDVKELLSIAK